ncbi:thiamine phosphate synthase [Aquibaculum arenosum]|uniref:Thiamine-phosphate synthase n=1 Tax=Aquibaculum arenosum TaxID=3032591 RepID=A0ABT5YN40_9PROT|nr:thiamine phosphate synthase [Fodinicurvata sp. CAU 1616]MDF2096392.1 thiamine phosphate synthase [Fodinicurvata sp. CAU 1616]
MTRPTFDLSVYLVIGPGDCAGRRMSDVVARALAGGATLVQLRDKEASDHDMLALGEALIPLCRAARVPLIVNDRLDVALALGADGLHLGQDDDEAAAARARLGEDRILGVSAANAAELARVPLYAVDYIGVGPVFATSSKPDAGEAIGLEGVAAMRRLTDKPLVGIGGISTDRATAVIEAGANGVAVVSAIGGAEDPAQAARRLRDAVKDASTGQV